MNRIISLIIALFFMALGIAKSQTVDAYADSLRIAYQIPELGYAVVSGDSILELNVLGFKRVDSDYKAELTDRFHIGSNTKAITAFIAALLVKEGTIKWDTRFFDLFPELKNGSKKAYYNITLQSLLTYRTRLPKYTYTFAEPTTKIITGDNAQQRYLLAKYFLQQKPVKLVNGYAPTNVDYILAGLMLEKATGKPYKKLVTEFGKTIGVDFGFDNPNQTDTLQTWGHDENLKPIAPFDNYKLNWLLSAGNINVSMPEYVKFIQLLLKGLKGESALLPKEEFTKLMFSSPNFSYAWFNWVDDVSGNSIASNKGNAGSFTSQVTIVKEKGLCYIIFTNSFGTKTNNGIDAMQDYLMNQYGR